MAECSCKKSHHSEKIKKDLTTRLNRISGQINGVKKMIDENVYCDDILNQITAVKSALNGVSKLLLEKHIESCVMDQLKNGDDTIIEELTKTIRKMLN